MTSSEFKLSTSSSSDQLYLSPGVSSSNSAGVYRPTPFDFIGSFPAVLNRWQSETAFLSDPEKIKSHPSYQALVDNAELVLPLILEELRTKPSFLVWVLDDAFGFSPYPSDAIGDINAMADAWVTWGEQNDFIP